MLKFVPHLLALLWLISGNAAQQFRNCDYTENLVPGRRYEIFNNHYPRFYSPGSSCRWVARSDRPIKLSCGPFELPATDRCAQDSLTIFDASDSVGHRYCGSGNFEYVSTGTRVSIGLTTARSSPGGRFFCNITTVSPNPETNCSCGWKNPSRIVGGEETGINEYPMMAGLVDSSLGMVFCGGTIINNKQVLTAAHCVATRNISTLGVLVGDHDLTTGSDTNASKLFRANSIRVHDQYNSTTFDYDIAIIDLRGTITFTQEVGPVCLPFLHHRDTFAGMFVQVLGWGSTEFAGPTSPVLLKATLSVITNAECIRDYPEITYRQICTYASGKDTCQFDSGGPVLWQNPTTRRIVGIGVTSLGGACGQGDPASNTKVGALVSWIAANKPRGFEYCMIE